MTSHYLNQCWNIVNWTLMNKLNWNFKWNLHIFAQDNTVENVAWKMSAILSRPQCVKLLVLYLFWINQENKVIMKYVSNISVYYNAWAKKKKNPSNLYCNQTPKLLVSSCSGLYPIHWSQVLTHWGRVTHICVSKLIIIGSGNGLSTGWRQTISLPIKVYLY